MVGTIRIIKVAIVVLILIALGLAANGCNFSKNKQPNLIFISIDTTRADHIGCYGNSEARTPNIDTLAKKGFLFLNHMTPVPITLPSHTTMLTGHTPPSHGVHDNGVFFVPDSETTLAEILRDQGYSTAAFVGSFPLSSQFKIDQGFDVYDDHFLGKPKTTEKPEKYKSIYFDERQATSVVDAVIEHHKNVNKKPFFTFVHFFDPHQPLIPPPPYDILFRQSPYDGEIAYVDEQLGRMFDFFKEKGLWDNTIVVVTADHGEGLGDHGELTHAILLHQATLHVPLIIKGPGIKPGKTREWTLSTGLFATLLEMMNVEIPPISPPVGPSLIPLIENDGQKVPGEPEFTAFFETIAPRTSHGWSQLTGWMQGDWRYIHAPKPLLYNLAKDPEELNDQSDNEPNRIAEAIGSLKKYLRYYQTKKVGESFQTIDQGTAERLASLGYIQHDGSDMANFDDLLDVKNRVNPKDRVYDIAISSEAKSALKNGKYQKAFELNSILVKRNPGYSQGWAGLSAIYGMEKKWDLCLEHIDRAIRESPKDQSLHRTRGQYLIEMGRPEEGLPILLSLYKPEESLELCTWIGMAYLQLKKPQNAMEWFDKGLKLDPENHWLLLYQANQNAQNGNYAEAEMGFRKIIKRRPYFSLAYFNYAKMLYDAGYPQLAERLAKRTIRLNPSHQEGRKLLKKLHMIIEKQQLASKERQS